MSNPAAAGCHTFTLLFYNSQYAVFAYNIMLLFFVFISSGPYLENMTFCPFDGHRDKFSFIVSFARTDFYNLALVGLLFVHGFGNENPRLGF